MNTNMNGNGNKNVQEAINKLLDMFKEGNLEVVARAVFKGDNVPSDKWSFLNRLLMFLNNTEDARGYNQWQKAGRRVKKGSKAIYILAPILAKKEKEVEKEDESGEITKERKIIEVLVGFRGIPVFRYEDTDGDPVVKPDVKFNVPYEIKNIVQELGLTVLPVGYKEDGCYGSFNPWTKTLKVATPDMDVFLHELAHAVDNKIINGLKPGQRADQEVVAEFSAATIGYLMGYKISYKDVLEYIKSYSFQEIFKCMARIEKIIGYVVDKTRVATG